MRRFDKHRIELNTSRPTFQKELQERLQAREEQDRNLYTVSSSSTIPSSNTTSKLTESIQPIYTPWKTPSGFSR